MAIDTETIMQELVLKTIWVTEITAIEREARLTTGTVSCCVGTSRAVAVAQLADSITCVSKIILRACVCAELSVKEEANSASTTNSIRRACALCACRITVLTMFCACIPIFVDWTCGITSGSA